MKVFQMETFSRWVSAPSRLDRNSNSGGLMLFVKEDILSNLVEAEVKPIEGRIYRINL